MRFRKRLLAFILMLSIALVPAVALAAPNLTSMRFHAGSEHDRVVLDLTETADYELDTSADGRTVTLVMKGVHVKSSVPEPSFTGTRVQSVRWTAKGSEVYVTMQLAPGCKATAGQLQNPARIFIDAVPGAATPSMPGTQTGTTTGKSDSGSTQAGKTPAAGKNDTTTEKDAQAKAAAKHLGLPDGSLAYQLAPGLMEYAYRVWEDNRGWVTAYFIEADPARYTWKPALGAGQVPGLAKLSAISDANNAVAAINASFFNWNGDLIGVTKIDDAIAGTTYIERSAVGLTRDGRTLFGPVTYSGKVTAGGITQFVGGVDAERGTDTIVLYNKYYGKTTRTNAYGREFTVVDGKVTAVRAGGNSPIPENGWVVSMHGTPADIYSGIRVGDTVTIEQKLGGSWADATQIVSVGPRLVKDGRADVTTTAEQLGDIDRHAEPRSAFAVTKRGTYLLAVADGRQADTRGLTLSEWADLLITFGAQDALNLDGGGSSELLAGGRVLNHPSDGRERSIGLAILILPR